MYPTITLFSKTIGTYVLATLVGILIAGTFACIAAKKKGLDENDLLIVLLIAGVGIFVGGHVLYALTNIRSVLLLITRFDQVSSLTILLKYLDEIAGGSVFYGGLLGGLALGAVSAKRMHMNTVIVYDIAACAIPLMHGFGRIGCFLGGCCYGVECTWGFTYTRALIASANGMPRIPVQLVEASLNFLLFVMLFRMMQHDILKGKLIRVYLITYSVIRFALEYWRGDGYRGIWAGLSTSQWISMVLFTITTVCWIRAYLKKSFGRQNDTILMLFKADEEGILPDSD